MWTQTLCSMIPCMTVCRTIMEGPTNMCARQLAMHATGQLVSRFRAVVAPLKLGAGVRLELREQGGILPLAQDSLGHSRLS